MPKTFKARYTELKERQKATKANYAVAMWSKLTYDDKRMKERRYVVNMNGTVVTRFDTCDLNRSLHSFETEGWKYYEPKKEYRTLKELLESMDEALTNQGYRRMF